MPLPPDLQEPLDRFLGTIQPKRQPADEAEPAEIATDPDDHLIRLALILEPFARHVVHRRDRREGDLYVGRPSLWGNPHKLADPDDETARLIVIRDYARDFARRSGRQQLYMLGPIRRVLGRNGKLVCYCSPRACHAQVLAAWALGRRIQLDELGGI